MGVERFLYAQGPEYSAVLKELQAGRKKGHWMWFIFPQIKGLGRSSISQNFAIVNQEEAIEYLSNPVLGIFDAICISGIWQQCFDEGTNQLVCGCSTGIIHLLQFCQQLQLAPLHLPEGMPSCNFKEGFATGVTDSSHRKNSIVLLHLFPLPIGTSPCVATSLVMFITC